MNPIIHNKMAETLTMFGEIRKGCGWATIHGNWPLMVVTHSDEWEDIKSPNFAPGSLNFSFTDRENWIPPNEAVYRQLAREKWISLGKPSELSFLDRGNYIHPQIRVTKINNLEIEGRIYCPGTSKESWPSDSEITEPKILEKLDILCGQNLRVALRMFDVNESYPASMTLEIEDF